MRRSFTTILSTAAVAAVLHAAPALAQGHGHGHGKGHANDRRDDRRDDRHTVQQVPPGLAKKGGTPPGLAKKGGLPPGQAKKLYRTDDGVTVLRDVFGRNGYTVVRTEPAGDARYVYYRAADGAVRRAVVRQGDDDRLRFGNVPSDLLRQVVARLY